MKFSQHTKSGYTMIELTFVIIILGIVSSIGSEIIANIYKNYLLQRATFRASLKTELAAQQIANYLGYRIPGTTIARNPANVTDNVAVTDPTNNTDNTHVLLEWIGMDNDGFSAAIRPPWNGFCDTDPSVTGQNAITTPGSDLTLANTILSNLSNGEVALNGAAQYPAIFFRSPRFSYTSSPFSEKLYDILGPNGNDGCMGVVSADQSCISTVESTAFETLSFKVTPDPTNKVISEHYKLAWSAYSIMQIPKPNTNNLFDLKLCYNYQPWEGERLSNNNGCPGTLSTIISNVSVFKFAESGNTFRFKVCSQENIGEDFNVSICKEKAVIL